MISGISHRGSRLSLYAIGGGMVLVTAQPSRMGSIIEALEEEALKVKSYSVAACEEEEFEIKPRNRKGKHWQKHDRLPFYAGVKRRR